MGTPGMTTGRVDGRRAILVVGAGWLLTLGVDLFLHAGVLARLYVQSSPFLLSADAAFQRIPVGYSAFLVLTAALYWLMVRLATRGGRGGFLIGTGAGATVWGAMALGLYSISTASPTLLIGWWAGQTAELGLAGAVMGWADEGVPLRRVYLTVTVAVVLLVLLTVALQSLGIAPPMRTVAEGIVGS